MSLTAPHAGALVHLRLPGGAEYGRDEHRLDNITRWIQDNAFLFAFKRVLDLGSNVGHFPIVYRGLGAEVVAVEPNGANVQVFRDILEEVRPYNIRIIPEDLRAVDYDALGHFEVLSTLGIVYHLNKPWEIMAKILKATRPRLWLVESCLWPEVSEVKENRTPDCSFSNEWVLHPTEDEVERGIRECGYEPERIDLGPTYRSENKQPRGFWKAVRA